MGSDSLNNNSKKPVIFLMGPTASGKTDLAMALSEKLPVDIISVDSTLVYQSLDIGAAKPTREELQKYPHALIDIRDPAEPYSVADFCRDATRHVEQIHQRDRIPLLVGGTMMYFNALLQGLAKMPSSDTSVRAEIEAEAAQRGWPAMHQKLKSIDPAMAAQLHPNHSQRISRALEVFAASGKTMTEWQAEQDRGDNWLATYEVCQIGLLPANRTHLHQRIERRFRSMLEQGFEQEVQALINRGDLHVQLPAVRSVGYRQMWAYLSGDMSYDAMIDKGIAATRQLAKRQLTWLRGWPALQTIEPLDAHGNPRPMAEILDQALNYCERTTI